MFCPKCGQQNPETGKFCRSCGTDLGNVSSALSGILPRSHALVDKKGKPISFEGAITKFFTGLAFIVIACILGFTGAAGGHGWWYWMLIPGFGSLGSGIAQYLQIKRAESGRPTYSAAESQPAFQPHSDPRPLPPQQTHFASPESRYKTGDLVPPSVTDNTTRHLNMDSEKGTQALPKK
ncbi:MAG: zinc-ribbon domain-containing protein [Acidobacteriota bacterium]